MEVSSTSNLWTRSNSSQTNTEFHHQISQLVQNLIDTNLQQKYNPAESTGSTTQKFLIINSGLELSEELKDFCLSSTHPDKVLNFIVELKKSRDQQQQPDTKTILNNTNSIERNLILEISKKLLDFWIESSLCAEAFLRLSIHQSNSTQTGNFSRILFTVPETFHLNRSEFINFIFEQILHVFTTISEAISNGQQLEQVRTTFISSIIDRTFLRFHTDQDNFYTHFNSMTDNSNYHQIIVDTKDPFIQFILSLKDLCLENFITRRLVGKTLLGLGPTTINKVSKLIFLLDTYSNLNSTNTKLLHPTIEFLQKNPHWKYALFHGIPLKSRVESLEYYTSWSNFMWTETIDLIVKQDVKLDNIWTICTENWSLIIHNVCVDTKTMISSTCALVALLKSIKNSIAKEQENNSNPIIIPFVENLFASFNSQVSKILSCVTKCLDSTDENKRACGMAVGQILSSLIDSTKRYSKVDVTKKTTTTTSSTTTTTTRNNNNSTSGDGSLLKFESTFPLFLKFVNFYEQEEKEGKDIKIVKPMEKVQIKPRNVHRRFQLLDSDDEEEEEEEEDNNEKDNNETNRETLPFQPYDMSNDSPIDDSLHSLSSKNKKLPIYFSDICEILLEGHKEDENIAETLKQLSILRIPILLYNKIKIDSSMAQQLARILGELETRGIMEIPIICGLYELSVVHPLEVFQILAEISFDKDHFAMGQRTIALTRFSEITQLLAKQKCFSCFSEETGKLDKLLAKIHSPFIEEYMKLQRATRKCEQCFKATPKNAQASCDSNSTLSNTSQLQLVKGSSSETQSWQQIVDKRIEAKTRRFTSSKLNKSPHESVDVYSASLVPIIWSSLANPLMNNASLLMDSQAVNSTSLALFTAHVLRILGWVVLGTSGIYCPHLRNIATQGAAIINVFYKHADAHVRRSIIALLSIIITCSEGKHFIMEIFSAGKDNLFDKLKSHFSNDPDSETRFLFNNLMKFVAAAAAVEIGNYLT